MDIKTNNKSSTNVSVLIDINKLKRLLITTVISHQILTEMFMNKSKITVTKQFIGYYFNEFNQLLFRHRYTTIEHFQKKNCIISENILLFYFKFALHHFQQIFWIERCRNCSFICSCFIGSRCKNSKQSFYNIILRTLLIYNVNIKKIISF